MLDKIFNIVENKATEKAFNNLPNTRNYRVIAANYPIFKAIKSKPENALFVLFDKYTFRKNDQIIDENDLSYFVEDVEPNFEYNIDDNKFIVQKITYNEKPLAFPTYLSNSAQNITNTININASASNFNEMNVNNSITQQMNYLQIIADLENVTNNCFHISEYKEMMKYIKSRVETKEPVEESKIKKFFKFMGTQVRHLLDVFLSAYATALANKMFP